MKTINATIFERLAALQIINNPENKVATEHLKVYLDDANKFSISQEEREQIGWEDIKNDQGEIIQVKWSNTDYSKDIELSDFTVSFLTDKFKAREYSAADPYALAAAQLIEKLK